ncbi:MAG: hypothetical protein AABY46_01585 [Nitrospirota bacterium]
MKTVTTVALVIMVFLLIGGLVFREALSDFIDSMRADRPEAVIHFGKALDPSGRAVLNPTTFFQLGENVAWVVSFQTGVQARELVVALFEVTRDGAEIPLDKNKMTVEPTDEGAYNLAPTQVFWSLSPKDPDATHRTYRVKYLRDRVVAQGDFSIGLSAKGPP